MPVGGPEAEQPAPVPAPDPASGPASVPAPDPASGPAPIPLPLHRAPEVAPGVAARRPAARRGPADPVKSLMHRHRELCERAVDPLEIAAGLEAHGLTDRTASRYRHRDVFSLAEELYARVPGIVRAPDAPPPPRPGRDTEARAGWTLLALLPGAACLATVGLLRVTEGVLGGGARSAVTVAGALLVLLGLRASLRRGPLRAESRPIGAATVYGCWLLGYAMYGEGLLAQVMSGGPDGGWAGDLAPLLGLALAVAPAAWCAHLFSVHAHRKLAGSRALEEFGAAVRPVLLGTVALFLGALLVLLSLAGLAYGGGVPVAATALGVLLFLSRLLAVHGFPEPATTGLAAACAVEAAAPALILAGRLPGLDSLARPVDALIAAAGTGAVPTLACGAAALGLLIHAAVALSRASAHAAARVDTK
ncbi:hypothetical protein F0344_11170 [Streptomyces finlayi]|uniref:Integral membrane protein n=1 Tax=Streptomyces finlayi TaxID=67296 RepID=A0A7G7BV17_9ACTN|nr:hypothetical protein F0344_11170 [Streptomyces finlayi]